jgi:translation initiation factor 2B subunit (eIF-2B alpha/beta/delta family)
MYHLQLPQDVRDWESDRINGSAFLARKAVLLANSWPTLAQSIAMLRPSMVPIVNAMKEFDERVKDGFDSETVKAELIHSLDYEAERCVNLAVDSIFNQYQTQQYQSPSKDFVIGTFSRSSTLKLILERLLQSVKDINDAQASSIRIVCSKSTPGDEGELMANDIPNACCLADNTFQQYVKDGMINIVIVGADCVLSNQLGIVNKIGTRELSQVCKQSNIPIKCFADRWKLWDDKYYPPLEGIFEVVPKELFDSIIVPSASA